DGGYLLGTKPPVTQIFSSTGGSGGHAAPAGTFSASGAGSSASAGGGPFGLAFSRDIVVTANTAGDTPQAGSMSSYAVLPSGELAPASPAVMNNQTASTWALIAEKRSEERRVGKE